MGRYGEFAGAARQNLEIFQQCFQQRASKRQHAIPGPAQFGHGAAGHFDQECLEGRQFAFIVNDVEIRSEAGNTGSRIDCFAQGSGLIDQPTLLGLGTVPNTATCHADKRESGNGRLAVRGMIQSTYRSRY